MKSIPGRYFQAKSSKVIAAVLTKSLTNDGFVITVGESSEAYAVIYGKISDRLSGVARKIYFTDGSMFEFKDTPVADELVSDGKYNGALLHRLETSKRWIIGAVFGVLVLGFLTYKYGIPIAANLASKVTPEFALELMDDGTLTSLDEYFFDESKLNTDTKAKYTSIFNGLKNELPDADLKLKLLFRDGGAIGANAFALPGGTVVVTDALIELAINSDEIAGVLAHEIGHVVERHSLQQIYRSVGLYVMILSITGDGSQIIEEVLTQASLMVSLSYGREFETSADRYSVKLMMANDGNPLAMADLLERIMENAGVEDGETGILSSHPGTKDRRKYIKKLIEEADKF